MELILHVVASAGLVWFLAVLWSRDRLPECTDRIRTSEQFQACQPLGSHCRSEVHKFNREISLQVIHCEPPLHATSCIGVLALHVVPPWSRRDSTGIRRPQSE